MQELWRTCPVYREAKALWKAKTMQVQRNHTPPDHKLLGTHSVPNFYIRLMVELGGCQPTKGPPSGGEGRHQSEDEFLRGHCMDGEIGAEESSF